MDLRLSRKDIRFLMIFKFYNAFFGFAPFNVSKTRKVVELKKVRYLTTAGIILLGTIQTYVVYPILTQNFPVFRLSNKITSLFLYVSNVVFYVLCLMNCTTSRTRKWIRMIQLFVEIDKMLGNENKLDVNVLTNFSAQFLVLHLIYILLTIYRFSSYGQLNLQKMIIHTMNMLSFLYPYVFSILASNICLAIRWRFKEAKGLFAFEYREILCSKNFRTRKNIQIVRFLFAANNTIIGIFNDLMGLQILIVFVKMIAITLGYLDGWVTDHLKTSAKDSLISIGLMIATTMFNVGFIIYSCNSATLEAEKLYRSCRNLQRKFQPKSYESKELNFLSKQLRNRTGFSAAGFFNINSKLLLSLINIISTYLIVIIQLNGISN